MASLPSPSPPNSSGSVSANTPSSPSLVRTSAGMYSFFRCHSCACGSTSASAKRRICVRISDSVSSSPVSPKVVTAGCAAISSARRALRPSSVPPSIRPPTCSSKRRISARGTPSADSRTVSTWLMGMPPASCARYSPKAAAVISRSISVSRPSASSRLAQPSICRSAST